MIFKPFNKSTRPESGLLTARIRRGCEISIDMVDIMYFQDTNNQKQQVHVYGGSTFRRSELYQLVSLVHFLCKLNKFIRHEIWKKYSSYIWFLEKWIYDPHCSN